MRILRSRSYSPFATVSLFRRVSPCCREPIPWIAPIQPYNSVPSSVVEKVSFLAPGKTEAHKPHAGIRSRQTAPTSSTPGMNVRQIVWWTASVCMFGRFRHLPCRQIQVGPVREILFPCRFLSPEELLLMFSPGGMGILIRIADFPVIQVSGPHFKSWMHAANSHAIQRSSTFLIQFWPPSLPWKILLRH